MQSQWVIQFEWILCKLSIFIYHLACKIDIFLEMMLNSFSIMKWNWFTQHLIIYSMLLTCPKQENCKHCWYLGFPFAFFSFAFPRLSLPNALFICHFFFCRTEIPRKLLSKQAMERNSKYKLCPLYISDFLWQKEEL